MSVKEEIRSVYYGDVRIFDLCRYSLRSLRNRCAEINKEDGYAHYKVSVNRMTGDAYVKAYEKD